MKPLLTLSMFVGLMLAMSVPAMAQCADCGGKGDNGAVKTDDGIAITTPKGGIFVDTRQEGELRTNPPVNTWMCDPWEPFCEEP